MTYNLSVLRRGSKGELVKVWQEFLRGESLYSLGIDGDFGPGTHAATVTFEGKHNVPQDGIVDDTLWGIALSNGLCLAGSRWDMPPKPPFPPVNVAMRNEMYGEIKYTPAPVPGNREAIRITNNWNAHHLTKVSIPQLRGVKGAPPDGTIFWHRKGVDQIKGLFNDIEGEGLKHLILSWEGSWAPRYIRNNLNTLSNHSWATAFDINYWWNRLGRTPAPRGERGSVIELVPIANHWGFYWGGHFSRPDGMHFELAYIKE